MAKKKKDSIPVEASRPLQKVVRVNDIVDYHCTVAEDFGLDDAGHFAILDVLPDNGDEVIMMRVIEINAVEGTIKFRPIDDAESIASQINKAGESILVDRLTPPNPTIPGLWSDEDQNKQGQQALKLMRELQDMKDYFHFVSQTHKAKVKTIELQLRALAHGAFPADEDQGSLFSEPAELPTSKVDPSKLPHPNQLAGDELARKAAEAKCNLQLPSNGQIPHEEATTEKPKRRRSPSKIDTSKGVEVESVKGAVE